MREEKKRISIHKQHQATNTHNQTIIFAFLLKIRKIHTRWWAENFFFLSHRRREIQFRREIEVNACGFIWRALFLAAQHFQRMFSFLSFRSEFMVKHYVFVNNFFFRLEVYFVRFLFSRTLLLANEISYQWFKVVFHWVKFKKKNTMKNHSVHCAIAKRMKWPTWFTKNIIKLNLKNHNILNNHVK